MNRNHVDNHNQDRKFDEQRIQVELVKTLYQQSNPTLIGIFLCATGVAWMFLGESSTQTISIWLGTVYLLTLFRYLTAQSFRKHERSLAESIRWGWYFASLAFLSGCTWGVASIILFTEDVVLMSFLTMVLLGMVVASLAALSAITWAYFAYALATCLPLIFQYMTYGDAKYFKFGVLVSLFLTIMLAFARLNHRMIRQSIVLRFENIELIEQLKEQKEDAENARRVAEEANAAKTKFLAAASHDLRQPLYAMELFLGVLEDRAGNDEQKAVVYKIQKSSTTMGNLLESLLDISKLDAGVIQAERSPFAVQDMLDSLWHEFESHADDNNLRLRFAPSLLWVNSDRGIVERILRNLIFNAIRYTKKGSVLVGCRRKPTGVMLGVYDTGIGIPPDKMDEVFLEFYQLHNPERDRSKGLGLGLAIVRRLAKLLEAPLYTSSRPDRGSMFAIELPLESPGINPLPVAKTWVDYQVLSGKTILVVDDEVTIREGLVELLSGWKCKVVAVASGEEAMIHLKRHSVQPDLILADYRLSNDESATDIIQAVQNLHAHSPLPAIIITGDTAPHRIQEAQASGYQLLHKPISAAKLRTLMSYTLLKAEP